VENGAGQARQASLAQGPPPRGGSGPRGWEGYNMEGGAPPPAPALPASPRALPPPGEPEIAPASPASRRGGSPSGGETPRAAVAVAAAAGGLVADPPPPEVHQEDVKVRGGLCWRLLH
jgi:hypothetical protein